MAEHELKGCSTGGPQRGLLASSRRVSHHVVRGVGRCLCDQDGDEGDLPRCVGGGEGRGVWLASPTQLPVHDTHAIKGWHWGQPQRAHLGCLVPEAEVLRGCGGGVHLRLALLISAAGTGAGGMRTAGERDRQSEVPANAAAKAPSSLHTPNIARTSGWRPRAAASAGCTQRRPRRARPGRCDTLHTPAEQGQHKGDASA